MIKKNIAVEILPRALWGVMIVCLFLSQYLAYWPPKLTNNAFLLWLGIILSIGGFILWMYVAYRMRVGGGIRIKNKNLMTNGPFRYTRHPMYISVSIMLIGIGLLLFSSWIWFVVLLIFIPIWYVDCKIEEKYMIKLFGEKYLDYKKRTGMFFRK